MKASVDVLDTAKGRKVCILGDMFELGENEKQLHYRSRQLSGTKADGCFADGRCAVDVGCARVPKITGRIMPVRIHAVCIHLQQKRNLLHNCLHF